VRLLSVFLGIVIVGVSIGVAIRSSKLAHDARSTLDQERYSRMVAQENLELARGKITSLEGKLAKAQKKISGIKKMLEGIKAYNEDLKARLERAAELKAVMDVKIKELEKISSPF